MLLQSIIISIKVSFAATVFTLAAGILIARLFTRYEFKGKDMLETIIILPMVLPPSVTGYILLLLVGKRGPVGKAIHVLFGTSIIFTWAAASLAAFVVSLPMMYQSCKGAFLNVNHVYENAARSLGASETKIFWRITVPLSWPGIVGGIVLSFARALGEFGATLMVAGNIPGKTQTIPLAIYFAVEGGDLRTANMLMAIVLIFSFSTIYGLNQWLKTKSKGLQGE